MDKKYIYASYGIEYQNGKIMLPGYGFINPLLVNGNAKLGKGVWTFSTLPGTETYDTVYGAVKGTCVCDCNGCYAKTGFYKMSSTINALAIRTIIARDSIPFMIAAITAQIKADNIKLVRIHASGDFFSYEYINAWKKIVSVNKDCQFWTYTKNKAAENAFNGMENANIVKSLIPGIGLNFGHCNYIETTYNKLTKDGAKVHICRCGIDKDQHCVNCKGCIENDFVLFVEHSTDYKAEKDDRYNAIVNLINQQ